MKIIKDSLKKRFESYSANQIYALIGVTVLGFIAGVLSAINLPSSERWLGVLAALASLLMSVLFYYALKLVKQTKASAPHHKNIHRSVALESLLLAVVVAVLLLNILIAVTSYWYGNSIYGIAILSMSILVFMFDKFWYRFSYLLILLFAGVLVIELNS